MAFTDLGTLGGVGSTNAGQTGLELDITASIASGNFVVVVIATDNIANSSSDNSVTSVIFDDDGGGQALTKAVGATNTLAALAGASVSIWYGKLTSAMPSGDRITAAFSGATIGASAMTARKFSVTAGATISVEGTPGTLVSNTAADPGSLDVTTVSTECLRVRGIASQVGNNTALTPTASWTAWTNGNSATTGTTGEMCARAESRINTATSAASDPTYVSAIYASAYVCFKEPVAGISGTFAYTEASDTVAISGVVPIGATFAYTEARDTVAINGAPHNMGTFAYTEAYDTVAINGVVPIGATFAYTEAYDTVAINGVLHTTGTFAYIEARDTVLINESSASITGTFAYIEARDTVLINGIQTITGTFAYIEARDTVTINGTVGVAADWILETGSWNDAGIWDDSDFWNDGGLGAVYLDPALLGPTIVLSNNNLTATQTAAATGNTRAIAHHSAGKYYHEFTVNVAGDMKIGLCRAELPLTQYLGEDSLLSIGVDDGGGWIGAGGTTTAPALINGHTYGMATHIDGVGGGAAWCKDITAGGFWNADASANPVTGVNGATFFVEVTTGFAAKVDGSGADVNDGSGQPIIVRIS